MDGIDPNNPPDWVKRMIERAAAATEGLLHTRAEISKTGELGGANVISLGPGTFVVPFPVGWSFHPEHPHEGRIRPKEGYDIHYRIDSHEDAEAATGGPGLLRYASEPEFKDVVQSPGDIITDFLISIPDNDPVGKAIVWKCVEPFGGTHVRELLFRCPLVNDELVAHRMSIARAIGEWMTLGRFSPELTALDRVAQSAGLKRVNFQDLLLMRLPRDWKFQIYSEKEGRKEYVAEDPADRFNLWVQSDVMEMPSEAFARTFIEATATRIWVRAKEETEWPWAEMNYETLPEGDLLMTMSRKDGEQHKFHRIRWYRYGIRNGDFVWTEIDLVTPIEYLDDPDRPRVAALMDTELRHAWLRGRPPAGSADGGP